MRSGHPGSRSKVDWYYRPTLGAYTTRDLVVESLARVLPELKVPMEMAGYYMAMSFNSLCILVLGGGLGVVQ